MVSEDYRIKKIDNLMLDGKKIIDEDFQPTIKLPFKVVNPILFSIWAAEVQQFLLDNIPRNNVFAIDFCNMAKRKENEDKYPGNVAHGILLLKSLRTYLIEHPDHSVLKERRSLNQLTDGKIQNNRKIFIVHGHNDQLKTEVERFLTELNLEPIILHKQADLGKTIIEKVEHYSDVGFAIILLTKDDFGGALPSGQANTDDLSLLKYLNNPTQIQSISKKDQNFLLGQFFGWIKEIFSILKPRARQNVIFEFGYFIGLLGRKKVAALCEEDIDRPSDIEGLLYTPLDQRGEWKKKLAKEIDAAGIHIDEKWLHNSGFNGDSTNTSETYLKMKSYLRNTAFKELNIDRQDDYSYAKEIVYSNIQKLNPEFIDDMRKVGFINPDYSLTEMGSLFIRDTLGGYLLGHQ